MTRTDRRLAEKARLHVRQWFARRMPKNLRFHNLDHTLSVTRTALALGRATGLDAEQLELLEVAALFHDTGYALGYDEHEKRGADLAEAFMRKHREPENRIRALRSLILSTRMGQRPRTPSQAVLRDADSAKAGQADFSARGELLRQERELVLRERIGATAWLKENLAYLDRHIFHTPQANRRYGPQKRINLAQLRKRVAVSKAKDMAIAPHLLIDRDLSWLSFNDRVMQEAEDPRNPLLERVKFLAIFSSNLDEFYRVRVAALHALARLGKATRKALEVPPEKRIARINAKALAQQQRFGRLWRGTLIPLLERKGIVLRDEKRLTIAQRSFVEAHASRTILPKLFTAAVREGNAPFIEDRKLYFVCRVKHEGKQRGKQRLMLVNIPSDELGRFITLPAKRGRTELMLLDDAVRICLPQLFRGLEVLECHAIKLSRDAELYLDEEFAGTVKEKVRKSLRKRLTGVPARLLYDARMPKRTVHALRSLLHLEKADMVQGGRYHHFSDLFSLPVKGRNDLRDKPWPPLQHPSLRAGNAFTAADRGDMLLHFPYHDFKQVTTWLQRAARDPAVKRIRITLYRVATESTICEALLEALRRGKEVHAVVEVQARFDEGHNLKWGERLEQAGATVHYGFEGLKVHCKLCLIDRMKNGRIKRYAYLGTGNFNERTARIYSDTALITANPAITEEVAQVFRHLADRRTVLRTQHLLVAPNALRDAMEALVDKEMANAALGKPAGITLKLNSLEDRALISKLYDASQAGVPVRLIIRGICCLVPGAPGLSERIEAISIVDRYLEHARAYVFENAGNPRVYLSSADWMERNLDRRVEVAFPLLDGALRDEVIRLLGLQWADATKARVIDAGQTNPHRRAQRGKPRGHAQRDTYAQLHAAARKRNR